MSNRIIFLTRAYYPNIGGVEKHIYELSKKLVERGWRITIITEDRVDKNSPLQEKDYRIDGVEIIRIPVGGDDWFKKFRIWRWIWQQREIFLRADLTHCHDVFFWYLPLALLYPMRPVYTTFHGYESYPIKTKAIIYRKIFEYMSNRTICVGKFMTKWYHAHPTKIIYGAATIHRQKIIPKKNTAIFIGRLDEHTGIDIYVQAVALIRKKIPDFTLTVYGDGPLRGEIESPGIVVKGFDPKADREIGKYEFAFISRYLAILEAMVAKRLVIAHYDNQVKKDYLTMTPFAQWIDICSDAQRIVQTVLESEPRKDQIDSAYHWVSEHSWDDLVDVYLLLWHYDSW
ncbi:MAG TPA: glycosyltransferase family 4 protein [Patescibacteria group bacterium]|nr:glycosyltransferase family 4 protein [Patescibacteria group bacterium]